MVSIICEIIGAIAIIIVAFVSKNTNKKVDKIENLKNELKIDFKNGINQVTEKMDKNEIERLRFEILSFAGDLHNEIIKTRQEFETIFTMYDKYEELLKKYNMKNGYLDSEFEFVKEEYKKI